MNLSFSGKVAIVTGGASGIGRAVAELFATSGASVMIADMTMDGQKIAEKICANGGVAAFVRVDVRDATAVQELVRFTESTYGGVDILVNSAGIFPRGSLLDTTEELWDRVMDINLKGIYLTCQAVTPAMIRRGGGAIVNIGSLNASRGAPNLMAYSASKGGALTLTRNLAGALAEHRIRVNCIHPGWVATEGEMVVQRSQGQPDDWVEAESHKIPLGRIQTAEDIAPSVVFIASDAAALVTGQAFAVDGGLGLHY